MLETRSRYYSVFGFARECTASSSSPSSTSSSCCRRCWVVSRRFKGISARREHPFDRTCGFGRVAQVHVAILSATRRQRFIRLDTERICTSGECLRWERTDERIRTNGRRSKEIRRDRMNIFTKRNGEKLISRLFAQISGRSRCWKGNSTKLVARQILFADVLNPDVSDE